MINVVNVWYHYGLRPVLREVNLSVQTGELMCVMGPNGMGKSTLLGVIAGLLAPMQGHVEIDGIVRRQTVEDEHRIRERVAFLPDTPWTPPENTGLEFLLAVGRLYGVDEARLIDHAQRLLELFDLGRQADAPIRSYSTGQKKKIGICSALVTDAPILILDEPFSGGLDSSALLALSHVLRRLAEREEVTIVMAVPVPELVEGLADRIAVIKEGRILACDTPTGLRQQTDNAPTLADALERLIHPEGLNNIERYFEREEVRS